MRIPRWHCAHSAQPGESTAAALGQRLLQIEITALGKSQLGAAEARFSIWLLTMASDLSEHEVGELECPGTRHQDVNIGDKLIEVMVVELQNAK